MMKAIIFIIGLFEVINLLQISFLKNIENSNREVHFLIINRNYKIYVNLVAQTFTAMTFAM